MNSIVAKTVVGIDNDGLVGEGDSVFRDSGGLLEDAVDSPAASSAGHLNLKFIGVRHYGVGDWLFMRW